MDSIGLSACRGGSAGHVGEVLVEISKRGSFRVRGDTVEAAANGTADTAMAAALRAGGIVDEQAEGEESAEIAEDDAESEALEAADTVRAEAEEVVSEGEAGLEEVDPADPVLSLEGLVVEFLGHPCAQPRPVLKDEVRNLPRC